MTWKRTWLLAASAAAGSLLASACISPTFASGRASSHPRGLHVRPHVRLPAGDCQPYATASCLLPFPDDRFTRPDASTPTGLRMQLPAAAMPVNRSGERIAVGEYDRADGFSPGSTVVVHVPGLDSTQALQRTDPVSITDISASYAQAQPVVIIDESSGARQPIWTELDATATSPQSTNLLIHPARALSTGHTYVVALRNLRARNGALLAAPGWFERLRDRRRLRADERAQLARYERIFRALERAGIARRGLYEAWDYTIESAASISGRLLAIRDNAFAQLGDFDLADGVPQGSAPVFTIAASEQLTPELRRVQGSLMVPCYLITCGPSATSGFHYASANPDAVPTQLAGNVASVPFECVIPAAASAQHPARLVLYGHGFLSSHSEVEAAWVQQLAREYDMAFCATDWWGLASADLPAFINALRNVNELPAIVDRLQQGVLNALYLARLMRSPEGLVSNPAFQAGGQPLVANSDVYFYGNSIGGVLGGVLTAVSPDVRRAVLGVSGSDFFDLMVPRGSTFEVFGKFVLRNYRDSSLRPLVLDLLQQLWERADPDGYGAQMTSQPPPHTPSHVVLMQIAYGDFQVSMYAAAVEARTIGAAAYEPALEAAQRSRDADLLFGIPAISAYPYPGSAIVVWDSGLGRTQPPPLANLPPPPPAPEDQDPHEDPRYTPAAQLQISDFLAPDGAVVDVCGAMPCRSSQFVP